MYCCLYLLLILFTAQNSVLREGRLSRRVHIIHGNCLLPNCLFIKLR
jgi:hypothetical protein